MRKLRIAVAGAGLMGRRHIELVREAPQCELVAIVDPAPEAVHLAQQLAVRARETLADVLANDRPDGIILATPNDLHLPQGLECIEANVPVLIEKPIAHSYTAGLRLRQQAEKALAKLLVGHHRLHSPILERAGEIIASGELGEIVAVMGSALFHKPAHYFKEAPWRRNSGGGPILINLIHDIASLRALCGEISALHAFSSNATRGFIVEDTAAISLRFANGALGTFLLSDTAAAAKSWEQTSGENESYASYRDENCYLISGTRGSIEIPTMCCKFYPEGAERSWWKAFETKTFDISRVDPLARQLTHFCSVIRGNALPMVTARDGLQNLRVTEAVVESARTGQTVNLM